MQTNWKRGKRVILVEKNGYLGGSLAIGLSPLGFQDKHGKACIGGFAREFVDRLESTHDCLETCVCPKHNSVTSVNPEDVKLLAVRMCKEEGIDVLLQCEVLKVEKTGDSIRKIVVFGKGNEVAIEAGRYIDCTGDIDGIKIQVPER